MNKNLNTSRIKKNKTRDEFYTTSETAQRMFAYIIESELYGKTVYCNCDSKDSEIYKYLKANFNRYKLKKLFATCIQKEYVQYDGKVETIQSIEDGDCFSQFCLKLLDKCDIVATNPPFSQLAQYIDTMMKHNKDIITIINMMCLSHDILLPYTLNNKFNLCNGFKGFATYKRPDNTLAFVQSAAITTLLTNYSRRMPSLTTSELLAKGKLYKDDNTGEYEVRYIKDIPIDLEGTCLVPISAAALYEIKQKYDILGITDQCVVNGKNRFYRIRIKRKTFT